VESQAATAIAPTGGHAFASSGPFNLKELVRIERASTQIAGVEEEHSYDTVVTCRLDGVNIFNQFTADEIVAHLSVKVPKKRGPALFHTTGTRFVNLRVGGVHLNPVLTQECGNQYGEGVKNPVHNFHDGSIGENGRGPLTTLVSKLDPPSGCVKAQGNAILVPDFGVVYLAEYLVTPNARQLNMFRIEFGCGVSGRASGTGVGANGSNCPPPP
jgi:hypothetical protein